MVGLAYGLVFFVAYVGLLIMLPRIGARRPLSVPAMLLLWLLGVGILAGTILLLEPANRLALLVTNEAIYLALAEACIFVSAAASGSVSLKLLVETRRGHGADAFSRALGRHSAQAQFDHRLDRLQAQGMVMFDGHQYSLTERGRSLSRLGGALKRFLAVGDGG